MNGSSSHAVILNDTRGDAHFGCMRVMRAIEDNLARRGIKTIATSLVRNNWESDIFLLGALRESDLIVVNGEGTLHHGSKYGERLLRVACHAERTGKRLALINALYQDNPAHWGGYLGGFDLLAARDIVSRTEMEKASGRPALFCPDLSLSGGFIGGRLPEAQRHLLTIGDSVLKEANFKLRRLADSNPDAVFVTIQNRLKLSKPGYPQPLRALRTVYAGMYERAARFRNDHLIVPQGEAEFIDWLCASRLHVTGRFHAVCLCLATATPFIAVRSNSRKIESLLDFFELGDRRLVHEDALGEAVLDEGFSAFTSDEETRIGVGLEKAKNLTNTMFDALGDLSSKKSSLAGPE